MSSPTRSRSNPGFLHGLRQPVLRIQLGLPKALIEACQDSALLDRVEGIIQDRFTPTESIAITTDEGQPKETADLFSRNLPALQASKGRLARLIGATANQLLQAARIPSFEQPRAFWEPDTDESLILFGPAVENIPLAFFEAGYSRAANLIFSLFSQAHDPQAIDTEFESLQKFFIEPLSNQVAGGKSTIPMLRMAHQLEIPIRHLGAGVYQLGWGASARLFDRSSLDLDSAIGARMSTDKQRTALILKMAGLPVPRHFRVHSPEEAQEAATLLGFPVVIKPNNRDRGEGVTVDVANTEETVVAFLEAQRFSKQILVEEQIMGTCHRIFVAHGKLLFAVKRHPKSIIGDGEHTIQQLIDSTNQAELKKAAHKRLKPWPQDELALKCIQAAGYSLASVPDQGVRVPLRPIESTDWGGDAESVTDQIHPDNIQLAIDAAKLIRLEVAGIDLMTADITQPWHISGAAINEVNYAPFLGSSRPRTQAAMGRFFEDFFPNQGRIPVMAYVGGEEAREKALEEQRRWARKKVKCFFCSHEDSRSPSGLIQHSVGADQRLGVFERVQAILMNRSVERLVVLIQTDDLLEQGLPIDRFDQVIQVGRGFKLSPVLRELLRQHSKPTR